ncbi:MAG TPA: hypothetical protein VJQ50_12535 [Terriglobales bacterium]|nr:hypothetical protein [Terriglobales bacterium]
MSRGLCVATVWAAMLLVGCGGGSTPPPAIGISVSPSTVTLSPGSSQVFKATVINTTDTVVTWQVNNINGGNAKVGTISTFGVYVAPPTEPTPPTVNVKAISQADPSKSARALVTIGQPAGAANQQMQSLPIKMGTSGGNSLDLTKSGTTITCCSGTLGSLIERAGTFYILSNNHVLARSDQGKTGEPITQPGLVDSNCNPATPVANLSQFVQLPEGGTSTAPKTGTVDAAIAQIISGAVDTSGSILELGTASSTPEVPNPAPPASTTIAPLIGMGVAKAGRSSGLTCSSISSINTAVDISYTTSCSGGTTFYVQYNNQIVISGASFSAAGDSGSLVVNSKTAQPVGLLYGGDSSSTVANPIGAVLGALTDSKGNVPTIVGGAAHAVVCPTLAGAAPASEQTTAPLAASKIAHATEVSNRYATRLLANPAVAGIAVGRSEDATGNAAVVIYVKSLPHPGAFPAQLDGVRTRIVAISAAPAGAESAAGVPAVAVPESEVARVARVKEQQAEQLMRGNRAIFGVGIGASKDSPGEAALVLFVDKDMRYTAPAVMDGARTQVVRSDRFRAWGWNEHEQPQACRATSFAKDKQLLAPSSSGRGGALHAARHLIE